MSKVVKVTYNSESLHTEIVVDGQSFDTSRINGKEIADWAYPFMMRKVKWNGFYDEMVEALGGEKTFDLIFDGSEEALNELKEAWEDAPVNVISEDNVGNNVVIEYDESTLNTTITVNGTPFDTSRINGKEIEDWVYPFMVRKVKWDGIFEELEKVIGSDEYTIQFSGSNSAMKALMEERPETIEISKKRNSHNKSKISANTQNEKSEKQKKRELFLQRKADFLKKYGAAYQYSNNDNLQQVADHYYAQGIWNRDFRGWKSKGERFLIMSYVLETSLGSKNPKAGNEIDYNDRNLKKIANMFYYGGYYASPNYEKALEFYNKIEDLKGDDYINIAECYEKIARCNFLTGDYHNSISNFFDAINNHSSYIEYCNDNQLESEDEEDFESWQSCIDFHNQEISRIYVELSDCYLKLEDKKNIFESFKSAVEYDEENYLAQNYLGFCYLFGFGTSENFPDAAHCLYKAAEYDYPDAYYYLGCYYEIIRDTEKAKEIYKAGVELGSEECEERLSEMEHNSLNGNKIFTKDNLKKGLKAGVKAIGLIGSATFNPLLSGIAGGAESLISSIIDEDDDED